MKKSFQIIFTTIVIGVFVAGICTSCQRIVDPMVYSHDLINVEEPVKNIGFWKKITPVTGKENSVVLELTRDVDYLAWTKNNGEFISLPIPRGKLFQDTMKFKKGVHTFTFKEPGVYILNIHQVPNASENFNTEDMDFRGKVIVGPQAIKIIDKNFWGKCKKQAVYKIVNDSNHKTYGKLAGNHMTEFIYVSYGKKYWDSERKKNYRLYELQYKYSGFNLKPGEYVELLFPVEFSSDTRTCGMILKPVVQGNKTHYYGQTIIRSDDRYSVQGVFPGVHNGEFIRLDNKTFETLW